MLIKCIIFAVVAFIVIESIFKHDRSIRAMSDEALYERIQADAEDWVFNTPFTTEYIRRKGKNRGR
jgi:competence protein ComGC